MQSLISTELTIVFSLTRKFNCSPYMRFSFNSCVPKLISPLIELFFSQIDCESRRSSNSFSYIAFWKHIFYSEIPLTNFIYLSNVRIGVPIIISLRSLNLNLIDSLCSLLSSLFLSVISHIRVSFDAATTHKSN